ncbi:MAG: head-tail connector protein [Planctomycetaceae bacterium]
MARWVINNTADLPIAADQLRSHCRISDDRDDALLLLYAKAAAKLIGIDTRLAITLTQLSTEVAAGVRCVPLPRAPFHSVVSLYAINDDDTTTELDVDLVEHDCQTPGELSFDDDVPSDKPLRLTYQAGSDQLDPTIHLLIYQLVAHWYEHREAATSDSPPKEIPIGYKTIVRALDPMQDGVR